MGLLRSFQDLHQLLGPYKRSFWIILTLHVIPTIWSLVTFFAAATVILEISSSSTILGASQPASSGSGWLSAQLEAFSPHQRIMLGICLASASVFLGTVTNLILTYIVAAYLDDVVVYLQERAFENMLSYRMAFHDRTRRGDLTQLVTAEARNCRGLIKHLTSIFGALVSFLVYLAVILWISPTLTGTLLLLGSGAWWTGRRFSVMNRAVSEQAVTERAAALSIVQEGLFGIRAVKSLQQGTIVLDRFRVHAESSNQLFTRSGILQYLQAATTDLFGLFSITGVMLVSFRYPALVTSAEALMFLYVAHRLLATAGSLVRAYGLVQSLLPSVKIVEHFLKQADAEREREGSMEKERLLEQNITLEKVRLAYDGGKDILDGIDLTIGKGDRIGVVGPSGGGKSTLAHLLLRFYDPTGGSIEIDGIRIQDFRLSFLRQRIGLLSQDGFLFNTSVRENISMGRPGATEEEVCQAARNAHAHDFIQQLPRGYDTVVGDRGLKLSGGQRQRINIAQIFLKDPEVLILDEATSALDSHSEAVVQEAINGLSRNRTLILIAHRLSTLREVDRILVLQGGRIVEQGRWEELIVAKGAFAQAWELQVRALMSHSTPEAEAREGQGM